MNASPFLSFVHRCLFWQPKPSIVLEVHPAEMSKILDEAGRFPSRAAELPRSIEAQEAMRHLQELGIRGTLFDHPIKVSPEVPEGALRMRSGGLVVDFQVAP